MKRGGKIPTFWPKIYHCIEVDGALRSNGLKILLSSYCCQKESKTSLESLGNPPDNIASVVHFNHLGLVGAGSTNVSSKSSFMLRILVIIAIAHHWIDHLCEEILKNM